MFLSRCSSFCLLVYVILKVLSNGHNCIIERYFTLKMMRSVSPVFLFVQLNSVTTQEMYRIKDDIEFQLDLHQLNHQSNGTFSWIPFTQSNSAQIEFTMLDPHLRLYLQQSQRNQGIDRSVLPHSFTPGVIPKRDATSSIAFKVSTHVSSISSYSQSISIDLD